MMLGDVVEYMSSELRVGRLLVLIGRACPVSSYKKIAFVLTLGFCSGIKFAGFGDACYKMFIRVSGQRSEPQKILQKWLLQRGQGPKAESVLWERTWGQE